MDCKPAVSRLESGPVFQFELCPYGGTEDTLRLGRSAVKGMGVQIPLRVPSFADVKGIGIPLKLKPSGLAVRGRSSAPSFTERCQNGKWTALLMRWSRKSRVGSAPTLSAILESKPGRDRDSAGNGCDPQGLAFDWSAFRQFWITPLKVSKLPRKQLGCQRWHRASMLRYPPVWIVPPTLRQTALNTVAPFGDDCWTQLRSAKLCKRWANGSLADCKSAAPWGIAGSIPVACTRNYFQNQY